MFDDSDFLHGFIMGSLIGCCACLFIIGLLSMWCPKDMGFSSKQKLEIIQIIKENSQCRNQ